MADLGEYLNAINFTKKNLIKESEYPKEIEKDYIPFVVAKSLSYHQDAIALVNELNVRGTADHGLDNLRHFEFLLNTLRKGKRFAKWSKPPVDEAHIDLLCRKYPWSRKLANDMISIMTVEQKAALLHEYETGGLDNVKTKKRGNNIPS